MRILKAELSVADGSDSDPNQPFRSAIRGLLAEELEKAHLVLPYAGFLESSTNGVHQCFVLLLLGGEICVLLFDLEKDYLPTLVKHRYYQALEALDFLHSRDLCFGREYCIFGTPQFVHVVRPPCHPMSRHVPHYVVAPGTFDGFMICGYGTYDIGLLKAENSYSVTEPRRGDTLMNRTLPRLCLPAGAHPRVIYGVLATSCGGRVQAAPLSAREEM